MGLRYVESGKFAHGHDMGITKVAFSPEGRYIATAGLDGKVCIWDIGSRCLLHSFDGSCPVLSLIWIPPHDDTVLCGLQDGNMAVMRITPSDISVTGFWAHAYPVECLALRPADNRLASGAHRELLVWEWDERAGKIHLHHSVGEPAKKGWNESSEVIVTSVHWTSSAGCPAALLATYMFHGVLLVDARNWSRLRTINLHCVIPSASLSEDGMRLAISNATRGFEIYCMRSGASLGAIDNPNGDAHPTPVLFIHGSLALLGGSNTGELKVWDVMDTVSGGPTLNVPESEERQPPLMHILPVPKRAKALAVAAYYAESTDEFFIAAGVMNESSPSSCILWKASEHDPDAERADSHVRRCTRMCSRMFLISAFVTVGAVLTAYAQGVLDDVFEL